jgi:hypothetical protein
MVADEKEKPVAGKFDFDFKSIDWTTIARGFAMTLVGGALTSLSSTLAMSGPSVSHDSKTAGPSNGNKYLTPVLFGEEGFKDDLGNAVRIKGGRFVMVCKDGREVDLDDLRRKVEMLERVFEGAFVFDGGEGDG